MNYIELYEQEKRRADLLQYDLDAVDLFHASELERIAVQHQLDLMAKSAHIAILEQKLRLKEVN